MEHPKRIGKYEIEQFLGGGMSHVYRATDSVLGRRVAIKVLTPEAMTDPGAKDRFLQEARVASNIQHENIISIYDFGEDVLPDGLARPYMVMEFVEGESLRAAIEGGRAGDIGERLRIARQAARALEHIHSRKVIHRDIKPENIHLDRMGKVRLMDFGIASAAGAGAKAGTTSGTPFYMAPEQVLGVDVTIQADIYSFGIVLYELFTGKKPFQADTMEKVFELVLHQPLDAQPLIAANVPKPVIDVIVQCTSKKLMDRPLALGPVVDVLQAASVVEPAAPLVDKVEPGRLSPSAQRPPSEVRLAMPPAPAPQIQNATAKPSMSKTLLWTVAGAIAVALMIYGVVSLTAR